MLVLLLFVLTYMTARSRHVHIFNTADKQAKNAKRKKKIKSRDSHDLSLEDVLAVGGDKVGCIYFL